MLKKIYITLLLNLFGLASLGCSTTTNAENFKKLSPDSCVTLASSKLNIVLAAEWLPYLSSTRVCPLVIQHGKKPEIILVSISMESYYRDKPPSAAWENFPKPILINGKGESVGTLRALFPEESPGEMILTYGHWQGNIPGEIRMHVIHPGVAGNYDLPTLLWDKNKQRYVAQEK